MKKIFLLFTVLVGLGAAAQTTETKKKDWSKADQLRVKIAEFGFEIEDTPSGPRVS